MAGDKVMSGNMRLRIDGKVIFDAIGCTLTLGREVKSRAATKDTSAGSNTKSTKTWSAGFNGLAIYAGDGNDGHNFKDLFDLWNSDSSTLPVVQFIPDEADYTYYYEGSGIITGLSMTGNVDEDATITLDITGSGPITAYDKAVNDPDA